MEKRLIFAIVLSILVLMVYSSITARFYPASPLQQPAQQEVTTLKTPQETLQTELALTKSISPSELIEPLQNDDLSLSIDYLGSGIAESKVVEYDFVLPQKNIGLLIDWQGVEFKDRDVTDGLTISYDDKHKGFEVIKHYQLTENKYIVEMILEFISHSTTNTYVKYNLNIGSIEEDWLKKNPEEQRFAELSISLPGKVLRNNFLKFNPSVINENNIQWAGIRDKYFCSIIRPLQDGATITKSSNVGITNYTMQVPVTELSPGQTIKHSYLIYIGPQKYELIKTLGAGAENIINFGMFDSIAHIMLGVLNLLYKVSKNWGLAIILFSLVVFLVTSPLSIVSFRSMKNMQELQPIIEELKVKYKDSPQKMHKETMELYREKKINPLGGCLPMLLQMPIFLALYQSLMRFIDLKGAKFLWIKDLSLPDRFIVFPTKIPLLGNELNLLPIIMIVLMVVQQKITGVKHAQGDATAQQQKMMSLLMAVLFGIIFYTMPAGLVLYWTINSLLMLVFQMRMFLAKK